MLLNILHLEDSEKDAELMRSILEADQLECHVTRVETKNGFVRELEDHTFDIILADYNLPTFDGISALGIAKEKVPHVPFILISGTLGEEKAVDALKQGAADYLLKQNLLRLGAAVRSALQRAEELKKRKQAEEITSQERDFSQAVLDSLPGLFYLFDEQGKFLRWNKNFEHVSGYSTEDISSLSPLDLFGEPDKGIIAERIKQVFSKGQATAEAGFLSKDKIRTPYFFTGKLFSFDGKPSVIGMGIDISERKRAEEALKESEERFRSLYENSTVGIYRTTPDGRIILANPTLVEMLGYSSFAELSARNLENDGFEPSYPRKQFLERIEKDSQVKGLESVWICQDGKEIFVRESARVFRDKKANTLYYDGTVEDITERKRVEETLRESEKRYRSLFENMLEGYTFCKIILDYDKPRDFTYIDVNDAFEKLTGLKNVVGKKVSEVIPGIQESNRELFEIYGRVALTGKPERFETYIEFLGIWFSIAVYSPGKEYFIAVFDNITERKLAEEQLRQSEEQFRLITENATDLIVVLDLQGRRIYNSPSYKTILGDPASLRGTDSFREIHPDDREKIRAMFHETVRTGVGQRAEFRFLLEDGSIHLIESQGSVIRDQRGNVSQVVVVSRDVTEKKNLEEQYLRAQRMESLGTLAGGIAHDLNNVLAPILLSIDVLKRRFSDAGSLKMLTTIESSAFRGRDIIRQVLTFARGVEGERSLVQLRHLVSEMENIMKETFPKAIECVCDVPKNLWPLNADPTQLHQVMMNLSLNARDAMPNGGKLKLSAKNLVIDEHYAGMHINAKVGRYVVIKVEDTGHGIPQEYLEKIFEPFFTTKEVGKGTGLGLATAHSIVQSHGGFINVYSEPGRGTEFKIYLPAAEGGAAEAREEEKDSLPLGDGELILVVDDENSILEITRQTLEAFGYKVLVAKDGTEAIAHYAQNLENISVVLTDLMMPVMDGASTIRVLQKMNPAVKVIAASGMASNGSELKNVELGVQAFLHKPYRAEALLKTLRDVLGKG